jgi:hypothetical protein
LHSAALVVNKMPVQAGDAVFGGEEGGGTHAKSEDPAWKTRWDSLSWRQNTAGATAPQTEKTGRTVKHMTHDAIIS